MGYVSMAWNVIRLTRYASYLPLAKVGINLIMGLMDWVKTARAPEGAGGKKIVASEIVDLSRMVAVALGDATGGKYKVTIEVEE